MGRKLTRLNICEGTLFAAAGSTRMVWLQQPSKQANLQREIQHAPDLPMHHSVDRIFAQWYCLRVSKSNPAPLTHPARGPRAAAWWTAWRPEPHRFYSKWRLGDDESGARRQHSKNDFSLLGMDAGVCNLAMHQLLSAGCKWGVRRCYMPGLILMAKRKGIR